MGVHSGGGVTLSAIIEGVSSMRNTILAFVAAGPLTFAALTPALAVGLTCSDYPSLDKCPIYGVYENPTLPSSYQLPPRQIRRAHSHHGHYPYTG